MLTTSAAGAVLSDVMVLKDGTLNGITAALEDVCADTAVPSLTSEILLVTPSMAEAWLAARHPNRRIVPARVKELADLMRLGAWRLNGEAIVLDDHGVLLDGQHRLSAVLQLDTAVPFLVVRGVPLEAQTTLGQAIQRSRADILAMHGEASNKTLAGALAVLWRYDHQLLMAPKRCFLAQQTLEILLRYPNLSASMSWGLSVRQWLPGSVGSAMHYLMNKRDAALAKHFFSRLRDGIALTSDSPLYALRERLIAARTRLPRLSQWVYALWVIKSWNAMRLGGTPPALPWQPEVDPARFPQIQ